MIWVVSLALLQPGQAAPPAPAVGPVITDVRSPRGALLARAMVFPSRSGIEVRVQAQGLRPGHYGVHLHAVGRCEAPAFASAGAHWNPTGRQHGSLNPQGHHLGDLPNLDVDVDGGGRLEFTIIGADMGALLDADGAAVVIDAAPDNYRTNPSGNSGAHLACGIFRAG